MGNHRALRAAVALSAGLAGQRAAGGHGQRGLGRAAHPPAPVRDVRFTPPTKLDALLHAAQQLAQQQQYSGSSNQEGKPGQAGLGSRRALSGQLPATQSAAQLGVNGAQVSIPIS